MADHAWCQDIARDAAVRAAEDAAAADRPRLPDHRDLPAAVEHLRSLCQGHYQDFEELVEIVGRINARLERLEEASSAVEQENKGESMATNGLRTERVTLEITRPVIANYPAPAKYWIWQHLLRDIVQGDRESVRVVEEAVVSVDDRAYADRMGCDEERDFANRILDQRDAAIRERESLREQLESVACRAATAETALDARTSTSGEGSCDAPAASGGGEGEPVADAWGPQPASVWLTQDEIAVCVGLRNYCRGTWETWGRKDTLWLNRATTLAALLARSSPPEAAP